MTDFKTIIVILLIIGVLDLTRRGHRHVRRRRHANLSVRETIPVGRSSWITFGHRVRAGHTLAAMAVLVVILAVAS
jgi:hypothetical protein